MIRWSILSVLTLTQCSAGPMPVEVEAYGRQVADQRGDLVPLREKADRLEQLMVDHHLTPEGVFAYRVAYPYKDGPAEADHGDAMAWGALWATAEALRYRVTGEPEAARVRDRLLQGLSHLARISGTPGVHARTLAPIAPWRLRDEPDHPRHWAIGKGQHRGVDYEKLLWKTDNSKDLIVAWALALQVCLPQVENQQLRSDLLEDLSVTMRRLADDDWVLEEPDGTTVQFGDLHPAGPGSVSWLLGLCMATPIDLIPGFDLAIGTNAAILTALARVHDTQLGEPAYWPEFRDDGFCEAVSDGVYSFLRITQHNNDSLAAHGLWAILRTDPDDELHDAVGAAVCSMWRRHRHDRSALQTLLAFEAGVIDEDERADRLRELLYTFEVYPMDLVVRTTENTELEGVEHQLFNSERATHAMPINLQFAGSNHWKSNPTRLLRVQSPEGESIYTGMDYLLGYWWLRDLAARGVIPEYTEGE